MFGSQRDKPGTPPATPDRDLFDEGFQKKLEYLALVSRKVVVGRQRAERRSRRTGAGVEFADYRQYSHGDDIRHVDWNVYGRMGRLLLRLYEEEEDLSVYLLLDCSGSMGQGDPAKLDYARRLVAALAYVGLSHLDRVSIYAFSEAGVQRLPPLRGRNRIFKVFEFLRSLRPSGGTHLAESTRAFVAQHKRRGVAILLSDLFDPHGFEEGINQLRYGKFETHVIQVADGQDAEPGFSGELELVDAESGEARVLTVTPGMLEAYRGRYREHQQQAERFCAGKQVPYFRLETSVPAEDAVLRVLRRGGVVR